MNDCSLFSCTNSTPPLDSVALRSQFPALQQQIHDRPLVYLDNAASAQKPRQVLEAMQRFYMQDYANVHRGVHTLSQRATDLYKGARETVARFVGAKADEIVFTRNATEGLNLLAYTLGSRLQTGDEIILTTLEHHANIVPWQMAAARTGAVIRVAPLDADGNVTPQAIADLLSPRTRVVSIAHVSNTLGSVLPVVEIARLAHAAGAVLVVDGCQAVAHQAVALPGLGADFYVFTGHKLYGPTGIGVLWGRAELLNALPPFLTGGDMIEKVSFTGSRFRRAPQRFEAGTPPIAEAIGLAAAIDFVQSVGLHRIHAHEQALLAQASAALGVIPGLRIIGTSPGKAAIISFTLAAAHPHDIATVLDRQGVAVRAGHHCAQPLWESLGIAATTRASFAMYNTEADVTALVAAVADAQRLFG